MIHFLTHEVTGHHYPLAQTFCALLMVGLGGFKLENQARYSSAGFDKRRRVQVLLLAGFAVALLPGLFAITEAWSNYIPATTERLPRQFTLPSELADERAWVWATELSGTLWYYARKPAHKMDFASPEQRRVVYQYVLDRGEAQYIIIDGPDMQRVKDEMIASRATLEHRGELDGYPYYLIHWPPTEPQNK